MNKTQMSKLLEQAEEITTAIEEAQQAFDEYEDAEDAEDRDDARERFTEALTAINDEAAALHQQHQASRGDD